MKEALNQISSLVERFERNMEAYRSPAYNETQLRIEARHDRMVMLVGQIVTLHKQLSVAKTPDEKRRLQRQIDATDQQIDQLVYELYGLTEKEIQIVENPLK